MPASRALDALPPRELVLVVLLSAEGAMKARREIADYMKNKRTERARIRVSYQAV